MKEIKFKPIEASQIEIKVTDTKYKGSCVLLPYIDSRSAADILNDVVGVFNWEIKYKDVAGQIYGALSIYDEDRKIWVTKEDTGEESNIAEKKGQASDILKRCMARWGCDWLYHTPRVRIKCPESYYVNDKLNMSFTVKSIEFDINTKECLDLVIVDRFGKTVYDYKNGGTNIFNGQDNTSMRVPQAPTEFDNFPALKEFCSKKKMEEGINKDELLRFFNFYEKKCAEWKKYKVDWEKKWGSWGSDAKKRNYPSSNDATIQEYEEKTYGADDESFYY